MRESAGMINTQYISSEGRRPMANVVKKHSISFDLAQKMVDEAFARARELGVTENVAILGVSARDFSTLSRRSSLLAGSFAQSPTAIAGHHPADRGRDS